jgi:hypothetical protein
VNLETWQKQHQSRDMPPFYHLASLHSTCLSPSYSAYPRSTYPWRFYYRCPQCGVWVPGYPSRMGLLTRRINWFQRGARLASFSQLKSRPDWLFRNQFMTIMYRHSGDRHTILQCNETTAQVGAAGPITRLFELL